MGYTETQLQTLQNALASGQLRVRFSDGREVEYRTVAELKSAITEVTSAIAIDAGTSTPRRKIHRIYTDNGL